MYTLQNKIVVWIWFATMLGLLLWWICKADYYDLSDPYEHYVADQALIKAMTCPYSGRKWEKILCQIRFNNLHIRNAY